MTNRSASALLRSRISTRAYLDTPVPESEIREILDIARYAPSGGNLQPWKIHVVTGAARQRVIDAVKVSLSGNPFAVESELKIYPENLWEPYRTRRYVLGEAMYEKLGIAREDKSGRFAHLARNFEFFGAPAGLFFTLDRRFDKGQWAHLGMMMLAISLVAEERGLATCMQESWTTRAKTVCDTLGIPETEQFYCGMALGYADKSAPVNALRSDRAAVEEFATFHQK
ncbi:MAG: NADH dehydrogenase [Alphaproteobacteria bacterium RIFCSPHIGHO2_12_FULL_63_12]|nr:MAG: NADH dehydrogenase [Alphaproteobacteria bacterium RIFCSPHIGHO2_12_FULL_63_12]